jgi:hypothetical protein
MRRDRPRRRRSLVKRRVTRIRFPLRLSDGRLINPIPQDSILHTVFVIISVLLERC